MDEQQMERAFSRLSGRVTDLALETAQEMGRIADRLIEHMDRVDARVEQRLQQASDAQQRELDEQRVQVGELREQVSLLRGRLEDLANQVPGPDEVVARVAPAIEAAAERGAAKTAAPWWRTYGALGVVIAAGFTAIVTAASELPKLLRFVRDFWNFLSGN